MFFKIRNYAHVGPVTDVKITALNTYLSKKGDGKRTCPFVIKSSTFGTIASTKFSIRKNSRADNVGEREGGPCDGANKFLNNPRGHIFDGTRFQFTHKNVFKCLLIIGFSVFLNITVYGRSLKRLSNVSFCLTNRRN